MWESNCVKSGRSNLCVCVCMCVCVCPISCMYEQYVHVRQRLSSSVSSDVHSARLSQTCRFISHYFAVSLSLWKYVTLSLSFFLSLSASLCLSLSPPAASGFDSYEIIMKQQSARVRLGAKLSLSLWAVCYLWLPVPPPPIIFSSSPLFYPALNGWMDGWMNSPRLYIHIPCISTLRVFLRAYVHLLSVRSICCFLSFSFPQHFPVILS